MIRIMSRSPPGYSSQIFKAVSQEQAIHLQIDNHIEFSISVYFIHSVHVGNHHLKLPYWSDC